MGGFLTGLVGEMGSRIKAHNERSIGYQHQANEEHAQQYDRMAEEAEKNGNDALAADLHKASFGIRTTMPGQKVKAIKNADGSTFDPLDMQGIIAKHTRLSMQRNANSPGPMQPPSPNGATPQLPGQAPAMPSQLSPPPGLLQRIAGKLGVNMTGVHVGDSVMAPGSAAPAQPATPQSYPGLRVPGGLVNRTGQPVDGVPSIGGDLSSFYNK